MIQIVTNPRYALIAFGPWLIVGLLWLYLAYAGGPVLGISTVEILSVDKTSIVAVRRYQKRRDCQTLSASYAVQRVARPGEASVMAPLPVRVSILNAPRGQVNELRLAAPMPPLPPGEYRLRISVSWRCNPFQTQSVIVKSNPFVLP